MLCYAALPLIRLGPWAVLPIELLHGVTFGLGWGVGTAVCKRLAVKGLEASLQGLFQSVYFGLGYGVGALAGGLFSSFCSLQWMFLAGGVLLLAGWGAVVLLRTTLHVKL
jgi:predicted MFS family arabinose efflux permease